MLKRTITALVIFLVITPLLIFPKLFIGLQIAVGLLALVAVYELLSNSKEKYHWSIKAATYTITAGLYITLIWTNQTDQMNLLKLFSSETIILLIVGLFSLLTFTIVFEDFNINDVGKLLLYVLYVVFGLSSLVILRASGLPFIIYLFLTTILTDVFAYLLGIKYGKHKMAPKISPKKSWEGAISGTIISTVLVSLFGIFYGSLLKGDIFNPNNYQTILDGIGFLNSINVVGKGMLIFSLTFVLSIVGQLGDLIASKIKRTYGIKDFGYIFPGHGGVLDRFDSAMFAGMFLIIILSLLLL